MHKNDLKDFLVDIMNEHHTIFSDISLYEEADAIFVKTVDSERFIVIVTPVVADETIIKLWAKKNPELMSLALGGLSMKDLECFTEEKANEYLSAILERSDFSSIEDLKTRLGNGE